jgi:cytoskeletal protein CcmA (bactofilin family)
MNKERPVAGPGTIIGGNVILTGTLKDAGDIAIHGKVEGEVTSERSVIVGETAEIKGPISGQIVTIAGTVRGSIDAGQKLELLPTGKVYGSISCRELIIRSGALFVGKSVMPVDETDDTVQSVETDDAEIAAFDSISQVVVEEEE